MTTNVYFCKSNTMPMSEDRKNNIKSEDIYLQEVYKDWLKFGATSILNIGKYEILFRSHNEYDATQNEVFEDKAIQYLNNGAVCTNEKLQYSLVFDDAYKSILECNFTMPSRHAWLGDVFSTLPYGIIKKNKTGLGATTLELNSKRNSIIVVPTRALAYEKAKNSRIPGTDKYRILYCGGKLKDFKTPTLSEYLADETIPYKKLLVVADSLPRTLDVIGEDNYKDFFIMIDEIDSYQYESHYRLNIEKVVDYYFRFPDGQRCMISATIGSFSNPLIKDEPIINVNFTDIEAREIILQPSNNPIVTALDKILQLRRDFPNDKILVAFNLVTKGILPIIESLPDELKVECCVLCGDKSKPHVKEYLYEVEDNHLPKQIAFMSSTYFVGVDFAERYHLVTVMDATFPWTLLSTDKLQQIAGRCRHKDGLFSETIIYNTRSGNTNSINYEELEKNIITDANILIELSSLFGKAKQKFPKLIKTYNEIYLDEIVDSSARSYFGSSYVKLVREVEDNIKIAYFNVDNILIQVRLLHTTYSNIRNLYDELKNEGNRVSLLSIKYEQNNILNEVAERIATQKEKTEKELMDAFISELREKRTLSERETLAQNRRNSYTNKVGVFLEHFNELQHYVPFEDLVSILPLHDNPKQYQQFYNAVIFWALDNEHPIKKTWVTSFVIGEKYTGAQIEEKVNSIWSGVLGLNKLGRKTAMSIAQEYFAVLKQTRARIDGRIPQRVYEVISLNPKGLPIEHVKFIASDTNIQRRIRI